jgi:hypothetical protein
MAPTLDLEPQKARVAKFDGKADGRLGGTDIKRAQRNL